MTLPIIPDDALPRCLAALSERLSASGGVVTPAQQEMTRRVFGEDLSPRHVAAKVAADVRERGDEAVADYLRRFDGARLSPNAFRVSEDDLARAHAAVSPEFLAAVKRSAENVRLFQEHCRTPFPPAREAGDGARLEMRFRALDRVGVYVPGGTAPLCSTAIMIAVPAQVAGVPEIAIATPCGRNGQVADELLATAWELGIREVYRVGGVPGIVALALGTDTVPRVDKIAGPGNTFVQAAKKEVYGTVDIDMIAGPSEILIVADDTASAAFCAADLLSQAEHNPGASILLTPSGELAKRTAAEVERQVALLDRSEAARQCIGQYGLIGVTRDLERCVMLANRFAPEHLEVMTSDPEALLPGLRNYGAVFLGAYTPEPVGDYIAGPSHVLPTGGSARFYSGLSLHDFVKRASVIRYSREALAGAVDDICRLADAEGLDAHSRSARIRFESEGDG